MYDILRCLASLMRISILSSHCLIGVRDFLDVIAYQEVTYGNPI